MRERQTIQRRGISFLLLFARDRQDLVAAAGSAVVLRGVCGGLPMQLLAQDALNVRLGLVDNLLRLALDENVQLAVPFL